jgi:Glycosyl hydrolases family 2, sugar binding domain/Beta-galactosidase second all-beta domain
MKKFIFLYFVFYAIGAYSADSDREWRRIIDLRGHWKFTVGDNENYAEEDFNDSDWDEIFVPARWEDEGYPGYDGFAWYRTTFRIKEVDDDLYLNLGYIDDNDEAYLNGKLIGFSGRNHPGFVTAYNQQRLYHIPKSVLNPDKKNVIAIRVYDDRLEGGIVRGKPGVYRRSFPFAKSLEGMWKFSTGDSEKWKEINYDDSAWDDFLVPMQWDMQGLKDYDGYGWYRIHFNIDERFKGQRLVLLLGKIDDFDETYLNGQFLGSTGYMNKNPRWNDYGDEYDTYRAYRFDADDLFFNKDNVLAVRVFDGRQIGGIYKGPIGITTWEGYSKWKRNHEDNFNNFFFNLFKHLNDD